MQIANSSYNLLIMSKIVVIGDIHGRAIWRKIIDENPDADKFIILGDYFDSHEKKYHSSKQAFNFKDILKKQEELGKDKLILLLGNHDYHYYYGRAKYSGFNQGTYFNVHESLDEAIKTGKIKLIHIEDGVLYSHAGVTKYWLEKVSNVQELDKLDFNDAFDIRTLDWNCEEGWNDYGDTISNSPIWVRPKSLVKDKIDGYKQIVGHTIVFGEHFEKMKKLGETEGVYVNDLLPNYYMVVTDGNVEYKKILFGENNLDISE